MASLRSSTSMSLVSSSPARDGRPFTDADELFRRCLIHRDNLEAAFPRAEVAHESEHVRRIHGLVDSDPAVREFWALIMHRHLIRQAAIFAGEALGGTGQLAEADLHAHRQTHLALMLGLLWKRVLADSLATSGADARACVDALRWLGAWIAAGHGDGGLMSALAVMPATGPRPAALVRCAAAVLTARDRIAAEFRPTGPGMTARVDQFLASLAEVHPPCAPWSDYEAHRNRNSGLVTLTLHTAIFCGRRLGVDAATLARLSPEHEALLDRFALIGALADDLLAPEPAVSDAAIVTRLIARHNERLHELAAELQAPDDPVKHVLLYAALRTSWAVHSLHREATPRDRATALRRVLGTTEPVH